MKLSEINIRDPFILPLSDGTYCMTGTRGATCWGDPPPTGFDAYRSRDLENWEGPIEIFAKTPDFAPDRCFWAPEIHAWHGAFFAFVTFDRADAPCKGTWILRSDSAFGPFRLHSCGPVSPAGQWCLDGTFYVDKHGSPWMVYCHEWLDAPEHDGTICAIPLADDLKAFAGEPRILFRASQAVPWGVPFEHPEDKRPCFVTDGPFMHRCSDGSLAMLWSSFGKDGYVQALARSDNGEIDGNWKIDEMPLFEKDGGHGMLFRDFSGTLRLVLHRPNNPATAERPVLIELTPDALARL